MSAEPRLAPHYPATAEPFVGFGKKPGRVSPRYETPPGTPPPPYGEGVRKKENTNALIKKVQTIPPAGGFSLSYTQRVRITFLGKRDDISDRKRTLWFFLSIGLLFLKSISA